MSGTTPFSLSQQFDTLGKPLSGGKLYIIQAGTVGTPQNAYQDSALTLPWPNPITLDDAGRLPQFFLADGTIKFRLTDVHSNTQVVADGIQVVGPSGGGGGGGGSVDATTVLATGDVKIRYGTGILSGFVRMNGRTIGSASSGATELANADTQALFDYLWNTDSTLTVSSGRGASSSADWTANKNITIPDQRGYLIGALDDMGNTAAGRLTLANLGTAPTVLGANGGSQSVTLSSANLPPHTHSGTTGNDSPDHTHSFQSSGTGSQPVGGTGGSGTNANLNNGTTSGASARHTHAFTTDNGPGTSAALNILPPMKLYTIYIKL